MSTKRPIVIETVDLKKGYNLRGKVFSSLRGILINVTRGETSR
jgi:hypothetical protein